MPALEPTRDGSRAGICFTSERIMDISFAILSQMAGDENVVTVNKSFVEFAGSLEGGMMLSQLLYWTPRSIMGGWIAKKDNEFSEELCCTVYGIRKARKALEELDVIVTKTKRFNGTPTLHYKVKPKELMEKWISYFDIDDSSKTQSPFVETEETITENTTENTTKTTTNNIYSYMQTLAEVSGIDISISQNKGWLGKEAKALKAAGYTEDQLQEHFGKGGTWYKQDFRGRKGQPPTTRQIRETIKRYVDADQAKPRFVYNDELMTYEEVRP